MPYKMNVRRSTKQGYSPRDCTPQRVFEPRFILTDKRVGVNTILNRHKEPEVDEVMASAAPGTECSRLRERVVTFSGLA